MNSKLVSVIIPAFNAEKFIDKALNSIEEQTYKNIEVLVVDDCSTDNTYKLLCERARQHTYRFPMIVEKMETNSGHGNARNRGMEAMAGEYVMFLDSDDTLEPNAIAMLVAGMKEDIDICMSSFYRKRADRKQMNLFSDKEGVFTSRELLSDVLSVWPLNWFSCVGTKLYKKETINKNNIRFNDSDYKYNEDLGFIVDYMRVCERIRVIKDEIYCYKYTPGSVQHRKKYRENSVYTIRNSRMNFKRLLEENNIYENKKLSFMSNQIDAFFGMFLSKWDSYKEFYSLFETIRRFPESEEFRIDMAKGMSRRIFVSNLIHNRPRNEFIFFWLLNNLKAIKALIVDR